MAKKIGCTFFLQVILWAGLAGVSAAGHSAEPAAAVQAEQKDEKQNDAKAKVVDDKKKAKQKAKEAKEAEKKAKQEAKKAEKKPEEAKPLKPKKIFVTGSVLNRYRLRTTDGPSDHEVDTIVGVNVNDPLIDHLSGSFQVGGKIDLNGHEGKSDPLSGVYDAFEENQIPRIYYGYMDIRKYKPIAHIRLGRQHIYEMEHFYLDGALLETIPIYGFTFTFFGGAPVHMYENKWGSDLGDWTAGSQLQWQPVARLRFRFDYAHVKDDQGAYFTAAGSTQEDDYLSWSAWYDVNKAKTIFLATRMTAFFDQLRDAGAQIDFTFPKKGLTVRARAYRLLEGYDVRVFDFDALRIAGTYQPYSEFGTSVTKEFGEKFAIDAGFAKRMLDEKQTVSAFNHGFDRGYATFSTFNFPWKGFNFSLTGDYYFGRDSSYKNNSAAASASVSQSLLKDRLVLNGGSSYYLYRYNITTQNESDDVRVYFGGVDAKLRKGLKLKTQYELENNDFGKFQTVTSSIKWDF